MLLIRRVRRSFWAPSAAANWRRGYRSGAPATPGSAHRPPQRTSAGLRPRAPRRPSSARASCSEPPTPREATKISEGPPPLPWHRPKALRVRETRRSPRNGSSSPFCVLLVVHKPMVPIGLSGPAVPWRHEDGAHGTRNEPTYCNRTATGPVRAGTQRADHEGTRGASGLGKTRTGTVRYATGRGAWDWKSRRRC